MAGPKYGTRTVAENIVPYNYQTTAGAGGHSAAMATPIVVPTTALIECLLWLQTAAHSVLGGEAETVPHGQNFSNSCLFKQTNEL